MARTSNDEDLFPFLSFKSSSNWKMRFEVTCWPIQCLRGISHAMWNNKITDETRLITKFLIPAWEEAWKTKRWIKLKLQNELRPCVTTDDEWKSEDSLSIVLLTLLRLVLYVFQNYWYSSYPIRWSYPLLLFFEWGSVNLESSVDWSVLINLVFDTTPMLLTTMWDEVEQWNHLTTESNNLSFCCWSFISVLTI